MGSTSREPTNTISTNLQKSRRMNHLEEVQPTEFTISEEILKSAGYVEHPSPFSDQFLHKYWFKTIKQDEGTLAERTLFVLGIKQKTSVFRVGGFDWWPRFQVPVNIPCRTNDSQAVSIELSQWLNDSGHYTGITIDQIEQTAIDIFQKLNGICKQ